MLEMLDYTIRIGSTPTIFISICISILPMQHTTFIGHSNMATVAFSVPTIDARSSPIFQISGLVAVIGSRRVGEIGHMGLTTED